MFLPRDIINTKFAFFHLIFISNLRRYFFPLQGVYCNNRCCGNNYTFIRDMVSSGNDQKELLSFSHAELVRTHFDRHMTDLKILVNVTSGVHTYIHRWASLTRNLTS
jgi:hypothetical protein